MYRNQPMSVNASILQETYLQNKNKATEKGSAYFMVSFMRNNENAFIIYSNVEMMSPEVDNSFAK